jgi:hypothetical protein
LSRRSASFRLIQAPPVGIVKTPTQFRPVALISANVDRDEKANELSLLLWTQMLGFPL